MTAIAWSEFRAGEAKPAALQAIIWLSMESVCSVAPATCSCFIFWEGLGASATE